MYTPKQLHIKARDSSNNINKLFYQTLGALQKNVIEMGDRTEGEIVTTFVVSTGNLPDVLSKIGFFRRVLNMSLPNGWKGHKPHVIRRIDDNYNLYLRAIKDNV